MKRVAIVGSHGLYAKYGGWDQLVKNLVQRKSENDINYLIFNSKESPKYIPNLPNGVKIKHVNLRASGFEGLFYDFWTIIMCYFKVDIILLLGVQGIPLILFLKLFKKTKIISNIGGIEWERPKFSFLAKIYLKFCFNLSFYLSKKVILDNEFYLNFVPKNRISKSVVIPYGGEIDASLGITETLSEKFPFIGSEYYLSISRALEDNCLDKLCDIFSKSKSTLVLISNFSSSEYGKKVYKEFSATPNIVLIDGLYKKDELDLVRRCCKAYVHTHTLCGTAPSLVEMIISKRPIISIDVPQNRFTLDNTGVYFKTFEDLQNIINSNLDFNSYIPKVELLRKYDWAIIVNSYESLY
jgi:hypothetical protein